MQKRKNTPSTAKCSTCHRRERRPNQRTCRPCHAAWMRSSRTRAREARQ